MAISKALSSHRVIVLGPDTASTMALGMFIQGGSVSSPTYNGSLLQKFRRLFGEVKDDPVFIYRRDMEGFFFYISTALPTDDDDGQRWFALRSPSQFLDIIKSSDRSI
jgi:hypothetical protein